MRDLERDIRLLTSPFRVLPDFAIVGEAKCGTTSLYRYLLQHPAVLGADRKEPKNFIDHPESLLYCRSHYPSYPVKYFRQMQIGGSVIAGEATAEYFSNRRMPGRLKRLLPGIKIIVLLRNPVHRAYSDYRMLSERITTPSFEEVVDVSVKWLETPSLSDLVDAALEQEHFYLRFVARGLYLRALERWFGAFPPSQIQVIKSEDLFARTDDVLHQVCRFLGLESFELRDRATKRKGDYIFDVTQCTKQRLAEFYRPYNRDLYAFVKRDMNWEAEFDAAVQ